MSDPAVINLSPEELYAHAKICLEASDNVPIHELVDVCQIFIFPSASVVRITFTHQKKLNIQTLVYLQVQGNIAAPLQPV